LVQKEDTSTIDWFLKWVLRVRKPAVFFSDGDLAVAKCIDAIPGVTHYLCWFHLMKNLQKNIRPIIGTDEFKTLMAEVNRLRNLTSSDEFEAQWRSFLEAQNSTKKYLSEQLGGFLLKKWPVCYRNHVYTGNLIARNHVYNKSRTHR
jgi:hypothetical protein